MSLPALPAAWKQLPSLVLQRASGLGHGSAVSEAREEERKRKLQLPRHQSPDGEAGKEREEELLNEAMSTVNRDFFKFPHAPSGAVGRRPSLLRQLTITEILSLSDRKQVFINLRSLPDDSDSKSVIKNRISLVPAANPA